MISLIRLLLLLLFVFFFFCASARDLNFTVPFVWARMNELIRNRTPPIRIRVESQEIDEENSDEFLCFVFFRLPAFFFDQMANFVSLEKQARIRTTTNNTEEGV